MQLLVSVRSAEDAMAALDGGADIIDTKEPRAGALGAVSMDALHDIHAAVAGYILQVQQGSVSQARRCAINDSVHALIKLAGVIDGVAHRRVRPDRGPAAGRCCR